METLGIGGAVPPPARHYFGLDCRRIITKWSMTRPVVNVARSPAPMMRSSNTIMVDLLIEFSEGAFDCKAGVVLELQKP